MALTSKEQLDEWKKIGKLEVTVSTLVSVTPAFVFALGIASSGGGEADAIVYDGHNAGGKFHIHLYCNDEEMDWIILSHPIYFRQGVFVDVGTHVEQVVVHYLPVKE